MIQEQIRACYEALHLGPVSSYIFIYCTHPKARFIHCVAEQTKQRATHTDDDNDDDDVDDDIGRLGRCVFEILQQMGIEQSLLSICHVKSKRRWGIFL